MAEDCKSVKFKYIFSDDYNPVYVNGAFGGVAPGGEVVISFYQERHPLPVSQTHAINADGTLGPEEAREPVDHEVSMIRFVSTGVTLNLNTARIVHEWLGQQIQALETLVERQRAVQAKKPEQQH